MNKIVSVIFCLILFTSTVIFPVNSNESEMVHTIYVDDDNAEGPWDGSIEHPYYCIQDGIRASHDGDIVFVFNGHYQEILSISKSISLIGEDRNNTVIDGGYIGNTIVINKDAVTVSHFSIIHSKQSREYAGVLMYTHDSKLNDTSNDNKIIDNKIMDNNNGIILDSSSSNTITKNVISNNQGYGICLSGSTNLITDNTFLNCGFFIEEGQQNSIMDNVFQNGGFFIRDAEAMRNKQNNISENMVNGRPVFYLENSSKITINDNDLGQVILANCSDITIACQEIMNTSVGIQLLSCSACDLAHNKIGGSKYGILIDDESVDITVENNQLIENTYGIYLGDGSWDPSNGNEITWNFFFCNRCALFSRGSSNNMITYNEFSRNEMGINLSYYTFFVPEGNENNMISKNNFLDNKNHANTVVTTPLIITFVNRNKWRQNYWDKPRILPYIIKGSRSIGFFTNFFIPWINIDWHPASEPYDIDGGGRL